MSDVSAKKISVLMDGKLVGMVKTMTDRGMSITVNGPVRQGSVHSFGLSMPGSLNIVKINAIVINASPAGVDVGFLENDNQTLAGIMSLLDKSEYKDPPGFVMEAEPVQDEEPAPAPRPQPKPEPVPQPRPAPAPKPEPKPEPESIPGLIRENLYETMPEAGQGNDIEIVDTFDYSADLYAAPPKKKVLIVEDTQQILNIYKLKLEQEGYDVSGVNSGEAALVYLRDERRPDLILLDLVMPGMDGFKLLQVIRSTPDLSDLQVIILSAKGASSEIDRAMSLGISGYLIKTATSPEKLAAELKTFFAFR